MQPVKKGMLIIGAPLALAAMLGGAVAFASQSGGAESAPARSHSTSHHSISQTAVSQTAVGEAGDGADCPYGKGAGAVSPAVY